MAVEPIVSFSLINQDIQDKTQLGYSYLAANRFQLVIDRCPNVSFYCQSAPIPAVSISAPTIGTPFVDYPVTGDKLIFDDFPVTFMIDSELSNYYELWRWILGYANAIDYTSIEEYQSLINNGLIKKDIVLEALLVTDMTLLVLNQDGRQVAKINFHNAFPVSLQGLNFDTTPSPDAPNLTGTCVFKYTNYSIELTPQ